MPESTINKTLLTTLTLFTILSISIGASNLFMGLRGDVTEIQEDIAKVEDNIDVLQSNVHSLELTDAVGEAHYQAILTELGETKEQVVELKIQNLKILEILGGFKVVE